MFIISEENYEVRNTEKKGRGVYAKKVIEPGTVIGDYLGTLVSSEEVDKNEEQYHDGLYYAAITDTQTVLPEKSSIGVHVINHSCEPNIAFLPYKGHILYVSLKKIFIGEELTVNYLIDPDHGERNYYICHCEAPTCKGTWYIHPKKIERFEKLFDEEAANQSEEDKKLTVGQALPKLSSYPDHFEDNSLYDIFGSATASPLSVDNTKLPSLQELRNLIRDNGTYLDFPNLKLRIHGISDNLIIIENL